jgi:hypothetical protein
MRKTDVLQARWRKESDKSESIIELRSINNVIDGWLMPRRSLSFSLPSLPLPPLLATLLNLSSAMHYTHIGVLQDFPSSLPHSQDIKPLKSRNPFKNRNSSSHLEFLSRFQAFPSSALHLKPPMASLLQSLKLLKLVLTTSLGIPQDTCTH